MKSVAYFFLLCGLLSSSLWGQSAPSNQRRVMVKCAALSCSSSVSVIHRASSDVVLGTFKPLPTVPSALRTSRREVKLGTFKPFPATSPRLVLSQASQPEKAQKMETALGTNDAFASPAILVRR